MCNTYSLYRSTIYDLAKTANKGLLNRRILLPVGSPDLLPVIPPTTAAKAFADLSPEFRDFRLADISHFELTREPTLKLPCGRTSTYTMAPLIFRPLVRTLLNRSYSTVQGASTSIATGVPASPWASSTIPAVVKNATAAQVPRTTWTRDEVQQVYETPLSQLTYAAVCYDLPLPAYLVLKRLCSHIDIELIKVNCRQ